MRLDISTLVPGSTLQLEAGTYEIVTPPIPRPRPCLTLPPGVTIAGRGAGTTLAFSGDMQGAEWRGLQLASGVTIRDLVIDTSALVGRVEQAHAMRADGPCEGIAIERVQFKHPNAGGDCIQLVGYPERMIRNVKISDCWFRSSGRSGIAMHSGVDGYVIEDCAFGGEGELGCAGQDWDTEGTGSIINGIVRDCTFDPAALGHSRSVCAVEIQDLERLEFHHNELRGRGLFVYGARASQFHHNYVLQSQIPNGAAVAFAKAIDGIELHHERYELAAGCDHRAVLAIVAAGSMTPRNVAIRDCEVIQHTADTGINAIAVVGLTIERLRYRYEGVGAPQVALAVQSGVGAATSDIAIRGCSFDGAAQFAAAVMLNNGAHDAVVTDNRSTRALRGLWLGIGVERVTDERNAFGAPG